MELYKDSLWDIASIISLPPTEDGVHHLSVCTYHQKYSLSLAMIKTQRNGTEWKLRTDSCKCQKNCWMNCGYKKASLNCCTLCINCFGMCDNVVLPIAEDKQQYGELSFNKFLKHQCQDYRKLSWKHLMTQSKFCHLQQMIWRSQDLLNRQNATEYLLCIFMHYVHVIINSTLPINTYIMIKC